MMWHAKEYGSLSHRFTQGLRVFFSDRKKGNFIKKENLGIKQESGNQMQKKSRAILIKVNLSC